MLAADDLNAALAQEAFFQDRRVHQYWDGERIFGRLVARRLALAAPIAWDIYLLFFPSTNWRGEKMPAPDFWMHQLDERPDLYLEPTRLMAEVQKAIKTLPRRLAHPEQRMSS
jgi:hypothetical protein